MIKGASVDLTFTSVSQRQTVVNINSNSKVFIEYVCIRLTHNILLWEDLVDSLSLLGSVGPDHGRYSVQLDDQTPQMFQAAQLTPAVQVWIYYISHLVPGEHTLHVVNEDNAVFAIDAVIFSTIVNVTTRCGFYFPLYGECLTDWVQCDTITCHDSSAKLRNSVI